MNWRALVIGLIVNFKACNGFFFFLGKRLVTKLLHTYNFVSVWGIRYLQIKPCTDFFILCIWSISNTVPISPLGILVCAIRVCARPLHRQLHCGLDSHGHNNGPVTRINKATLINRNDIGANDCTNQHVLLPRTFREEWKWVRINLSKSLPCQLKTTGYEVQLYSIFTYTCPMKWT